MQNLTKQLLCMHQKYTGYQPKQCLQCCKIDSNAVALLELTCPLELVNHLELARDRKLGKEDYQLFLSELSAYVREDTKPISLSNFSMILKALYNIIVRFVALTML